MTGVTRASRNIAHRLIEEFMLAANEAVAPHLESLGVPTLYRIHERPDPKRVADFEELASHLLRLLPSRRRRSSEEVPGHEACQIRRQTSRRRRSPSTTHA